MVQVSRLRGRLQGLSFLPIQSSLSPLFDVIPLLYNPNSHNPLKERRAIMITDYYQQSIRALQLTGMSERTQEYNNVLHIFIFYIIQPVESENMMNVSDYSVEVIIAIVQICKCEECPQL
jgi:hypothetical protein